MNINTPKSFIKQKRTWFIIAIILFVLVLIGMIIASGLRHSAIINKVDKAYDKTKNSARLISASSRASRAERLSAIKELSKGQVIHSCSGEWWNSWYGAVLSSARAEVEDCNAKLKQLSLVSGAATKTNEYLEDDIKVAKTLAILRIATGSEDWQKTALSSAESALRDIEAMPTTKDNKLLLGASKDKLIGIVNAWNALNQASSKEDKAAYQKAEADLTQAYANLGAISDVSDAQVEKLVMSLQKIINKL